MYYPRSGSQRQRPRPRRRLRQASMCSTSLKLSPYFAIRRTTRPTHSRNYNASRRDANNKSNNRRQPQKQRRRRRAQNVFYGLFKCLRKQQSEARSDVTSDSAVTIVRAFASRCSARSLTPLSYSHLSLPSPTYFLELT